MPNSVTTNYSADLYNPEMIIEKLFIQNQAIDKGSVLALEKPNSSTKFVVPRLDVSANNLQKYQATPTNAKGTATYDEKLFELKEFMFYTTFNPRDYEDIWEAYRMNGKRVDKTLNPQIRARIVNLFMKSINRQVGDLIWQGDTASTNDALNLFDGLLKRIDSDADVIDVTSVGAITKANILSIMQTMYEAIPDEVLEAEGLAFHMNTTDFKNYGLALKTLDFKGTEYMDALPNTFCGIPIKNYSGLPKNRILAARGTNTMESNLFFGLESISDINDIVIDKVANNSDEWFMKAVSNGDCQIGFGNEIVNYLGV